MQAGHEGIEEGMQRIKLDEENVEEHKTEESAGPKLIGYFDNIDVPNEIHIH